MISPGVVETELGSDITGDLVKGGLKELGTLRWGSPDDVSESIFHAYADAGGNFIDTANVYTKGRSEELIGGYIAARSLRD